MPCPEKFRESLYLYSVDQAVIDKINEGYEHIVSRTSKKVKAAYFTNAMKLLDENLDFEITYNILDYNACCKGGARDKDVKALAKEIKNKLLSEKVEALRHMPNMGQPVLNTDGTITAYLHNYVDGKYRCSCPNFNKLKVLAPVSPTYCLCCGGHFRYHYQNALGVKLKTKEIVSTPLDGIGKSPCIIVYELC